MFVQMCHSQELDNLPSFTHIGMDDHTEFIPFYDHHTLTRPSGQVFAEVADASSYAVVRELAAAVKKEEKPVASLESMVSFQL